MLRMDSGTRRVGAHLPLGGGMVKAADRAHEIGAEALQVFADNPTAWRRRAEPPRELSTFRERLEGYGIAPLSIHAPYLINLAGPEERFFGQSVRVMAHDLRAARGFGARYFNLHIGSHLGAGVETGIARIAEGLRLALAEVDNAPRAAVVALENSSGGGFGLGVGVAELAAIAEAIEARGISRERVAFCLDAAHAWGAGIDIGDPAVTDAFLEAFDRAIGLERLVMVHLNDSRSDLGSRHDRHEHLGAGKIGPQGLAYLLCHPLLGHATFILETPGMDEGYDAVNLARARDLMAGRPLPALPPEAMSVRGSRARSGPPERGERRLPAEADQPSHPPEGPAA
jgi:deoxyribonuclease-4